MTALPQVPGPPYVVAGVKRWNRRTVARLLTGPEGLPPMVDDVRPGLDLARQRGATLVAWASRLTDQDEAMAAAAGVRLVRLEDGFLRSVGLGAGLAAGLSYALDGTGMHYDARRPSDLETLLEAADLGAEERARGAELLARIRAARISKYNLDARAGREALGARWAGARRARPGPVVLIPGQVAQDASIRATLSATVDLTAGSRINEALLGAVRARNPDAVIVYKPHPDVAAGLRPGRVPEEVVRDLADCVVADASILDLIDAVDRIETLSSLTGFEALIRGKPVTVHGLPFYAGWGLTEDTTRCPRRTRRRTLDELAYLALVVYTRHLDPRRLQPCTAEALVDGLTRLARDPVHRLKTKALQHLSWAGRKLGV